MSSVGDQDSTGIASFDDVRALSTTKLSITGIDATYVVRSARPRFAEDTNRRVGSDASASERGQRGQPSSLVVSQAGRELARISLDIVNRFPKTVKQMRSD